MVGGLGTSLQLSAVPPGPPADVPAPVSCQLTPHFALPSCRPTAGAYDAIQFMQQGIPK